MRDHRPCRPRHGSSRSALRRWSCRRKASPVSLPLRLEPVRRYPTKPRGPELRLEQRPLPRDRYAPPRTPHALEHASSYNCPLVRGSATAITVATAELATSGRGKPRRKKSATAKKWRAGESYC